MRGVGKLGHFMLISGLLILGIYLGARVYATFSSRSEARRLENRPPASRQPVAQEHAAGLSFVFKEPDFSLWPPQSVDVGEKRSHSGRCWTGPVIHPEPRW